MKFVVYNPDTGDIVSTGEMPESGIDSFLAKGAPIIKTGEQLYPVVGYKVDLVTREIVVDPVKPSREPALRAAIRDELLQTDYTQSVDAPEHITETVIAAYRDYRRKLRDAYNRTTFLEIVLSLPLTDPKGNDPFMRFRDMLTPQDMEAIMPQANTANSS